VTYAWTNVFDTILDPSKMNDREAYRKLSGGSIIAPFEYSLSIDNKYTLYLSYRLNQRDYFEVELEIDSQYFDSAENGYVYSFMSQELDNYVDILESDGEDSINVYYFDDKGRMAFLDASHYEVVSREIVIKNDDNKLVQPNGITKFYVSFIPVGTDTQFSAYHFSYDATSITTTLDTTYWDVIGLDGVDVIPNLDGYYFINEDETTPQTVVCHASQVSAYLNEGKELEFNIEGELTNFNEDVIVDIHSGKYLTLYIDTNMKNAESILHLTIELYDSGGIMSEFTQIVTREELEMADFTINISLPTSSNTLKKIRFVPTFRTDKEYNR